MGKRSTRLCRSFWGLQFYDVPALAEMGAVDVAFTEATVGAGISTVGGLGCDNFPLTEEIERLMKLFSLIPVIVIGVLLLWAGPPMGGCGISCIPVSVSEPFYRQYRGGYGGAQYGDRCPR